MQLKLASVAENQDNPLHFCTTIGSLRYRQTHTKS